MSSKGIEPFTAINQFFYRESPLPIGSPALILKVKIFEIQNLKKNFFFFRFEFVKNILFINFIKLLFYYYLIKNLKSEKPKIKIQN